MPILLKFKNLQKRQCARRPSRADYEPTAQSLAGCAAKFCVSTYGRGATEVTAMDLSQPEAFRNAIEALVWPISGRFEPFIGRRCPFLATEGSHKPGNWSMDSVVLQEIPSADLQTQKLDAHPLSQ